MIATAITGGPADRTRHRGSARRRKPKSDPGTSTIYVRNDSHSDGWYIWRRKVISMPGSCHRATSARRENGRLFVVGATTRDDRLRR